MGKNRKFHKSVVFIIISLRKNCKLCFMFGFEEVTDSKAYCYAAKGCIGDKLAGFENRVVTKEECVDDGGESWGVDTIADGTRRCENVQFSGNRIISACLYC